MITVKEISDFLGKTIPLNLQESYDNCGLLLGNPESGITAVLTTLDVTEEVVKEAVERKCNLIVSHHPLIFSGIKRLTGGNYVARTVAEALKNEVAIYAAHTNLDNLKAGVNMDICRRLGLKKPEILLGGKEKMIKLVVFVPEGWEKKVLDALSALGAGTIGTKYEGCSFRTEGLGTFRGNEDSDPFLGEKNKITEAKELRLEMLVRERNRQSVIARLLQVHPYEEVAYDLYPLENGNPETGMGMCGIYEQPKTAEEFFEILKTNMQLLCLKHSPPVGKPITKVAVCGGAGRALVGQAIKAKADVLVTSELKYHDYFEAEGKILLVDIGHAESEKFTPDLLKNLLEPFAKDIKICCAQTNTNPITYVF